MQARVSELCGQAVPPATGCETERVRDCEPVPHVLVHVVQAWKPLTTQLRAQACWLHARVSSVCAQLLPPKRGCVQARLRFCEPPPHDLVHVV